MSGAGGRGLALALLALCLLFACGFAAWLLGWLA